MANCYSPTVVQPEIPVSDISPLERLLLDQIFSAPEDDGTLYLYAEERPSDYLIIPAKDLRKAFQASTSIPSQIASVIEDALKQSTADDDDIEIDLSSISFEPILQDIVRRSKTLPYITVTTSFMCDKMRPDCFGGLATLITADAIIGKSTDQILQELLQSAARAALPMTFHIDKTSSNDEYLYIDIPSRHATISIKAESEGVVVDIFPHGDSSSGPSATAAVLSSDLLPLPDS
jgi:hypothetical protein